MKIKAIGDSIVGLGFMALIAFFLWGVGYMFTQEIKQNDMMYEACIAADKQWIEGNCVK